MVSLQWYEFKVLNIEKVSFFFVSKKVFKYARLPSFKLLHDSPAKLDTLQNCSSMKVSQLIKGCESMRLNFIDWRLISTSKQESSSNMSSWWAQYARSCQEENQGNSQLTGEINLEKFFLKQDCDLFNLPIWHCTLRCTILYIYIY